jgi:hypothetical protein
VEIKCCILEGELQDDSVSSKVKDNVSKKVDLIKRNMETLFERLAMLADTVGNI